MAREKLVPKPPTTDERDPQKRFQDTASKVFSVPKADIDKREKEWKNRHNRPKPK
jgi:hypothetical protein